MCLTSDVEYHQDGIDAIQVSLESFLVEVFNRAWKFLPFHIIDLIITFLPFNLFTKKWSHLLDGAMVFKYLYSFSVTGKKRKSEILWYLKEQGIRAVFCGFKWISLLFKIIIQNKDLNFGFSRYLHTMFTRI